MSETIPISSKEPGIEVAAEAKTEQPSFSLPVGFDERDPEKVEAAIELLYPHADWHREQLTVLLDRLPSTQTVDSQGWVEIDGKNRYVGDLIQLSTARSTRMLLETETKRIFEHADKLRGKTKDLYKNIKNLNLSNDEAVRRLRVLAMIERLTTKANQEKKKTETTKTIGKTAVNL